MTFKNSWNVLISYLLHSQY